MPKPTSEQLSNQIISYQAEVQSLRQMLWSRDRQIEVLSSELKKNNEVNEVMKRHCQAADRAVGDQQKSLHTLVAVLGQVTLEKTAKAA
jgi:hypothetical protein